MPDADRLAGRRDENRHRGQRIKQRPQCVVDRPVLGAVKFFPQDVGCDTRREVGEVKKGAVNAAGGLNSHILKSRLNI